jgi:serine/threonine-protein kinase
MPADGSGTPERLTNINGINWPGSWSADGRVLAFATMDPNPAISGIHLLKLEGDRKPQPFLPAPAVGPVISPDGRWLAYESSESGRGEVYVTPYPGPGSKWQISADGGGEPVWNRNGRELFYRSGNKVLAVDVSTQPTFSAGKPTALFEGRYVVAAASPAEYDVSTDGQRFVMIKPSDETPPNQINFVLNWFEELKQKVPTGKK